MSVPDRDVVQAEMLALNEDKAVGERFTAVLDDVTTEDPAERARLISLELRRQQSYVEWLSRYRDEAVRAMRQTGASYERVAQALGVTKSRAQQLCRRLEHEDRR